MPAFLPTMVENVEKFDGYTVVAVTPKPGAALFGMEKKLRARARALVAAGVVDVAKGRTQAIEEAILNLDFDRIKNLTTVQYEDDGTYYVRVDTGGGGDD